MLTFSTEGYAALQIALASGLFGAAFFMLAQSNTKTTVGGASDVRSMWSWPLLLLRCLFGIGGALILYFFFQSGMLESAIWPDLKKLGFTSINVKGVPIGKLVPNNDLALLVVWSFLAGYSQTLVTNILSNTEAKANSK